MSAHQFEFILFDLDGTLTDPALGITNSVIYALKKFGIEVGDRAELYKFIGPPLQESFEVYYGFSVEESALAVEYYREYYKDEGIFENFVYPGIVGLLEALKREGKTLVLATSKPQVFAQRILEHYDLTDYFSFIAGSNLDGTRVKKAEVANYALAGSGVNDVSTAIMVGDRKHDILGAKENGLKSIGVLFGYGDRHELEEAGADYIVESVAELQKILGHT